MNLLDALIFRLPEFEFLCRTVDIGSSCCDLLAAGSTHEFIEARLRLSNKRFCLGKSRACSARVLAQQNLALRDLLAFGNQDLCDRFRRFGGQFNSIRGKLSDDAEFVTIGVTGSEQ